MLILNRNGPPGLICETIATAITKILNNSLQNTWNNDFLILNFSYSIARSSTWQKKQRQKINTDVGYFRLVLSPISVCALNTFVRYMQLPVTFNFVTPGSGRFSEKDSSQFTPCFNAYTRTVCKVLGLATVCRCYAEGGGKCYATL